MCSPLARVPVTRAITTVLEPSGPQWPFIFILLESLEPSFASCGNGVIQARHHWLIGVTLAVLLSPRRVPQWWCLNQGLWDLLSLPGAPPSVTLLNLHLRVQTKIKTFLSASSRAGARGSTLSLLLGIIIRLEQ